MMRLRLPAVIISGLLMLTGCAWLGGHSPGEKMTGAPGRTWAEYGCSSRKLPFIEVNEVEVTPETVVPGSSLNQRFVYSACLPQGRAELPVRLSVRIYHGGNEMLTDVQPQFLVRPGRWIVDATVLTPPTAPDGPYRLKVDISGAASADGATAFTIRRR